MKKLVMQLILIVLVTVACGSGGRAGQAETAEGLKVGEKTYTQADLAALPAAQATFKDVVYTGIPVTALMEDAGYATSDLKAVKAVAADGYTVNYDLSQIEKPNVIVSYAQADGPLTEEDGQFRMVLPDEEGKMNVRMLVELQAVQ